MNRASENLMGHVENRIISDHRIIPDSAETTTEEELRPPLQPSTPIAVAAALAEALGIFVQPSALPAVPDSVAEAELADGSTVWLVLDAADNELSHHTTEAAALAWAHSNVVEHQP